MKTVLLFFSFLIFGFYASAQDVRVEVSPERPVMGDVFKIIFKVNFSSNQEPYITFNAGGLEVLKKYNGGGSVETKFEQGKVVTHRLISYVYEVQAERSGRYKLSDIIIEIDGKDIRVADKIIEVLAQRPILQDFFLEAAPSKTEVYIGEGVDIPFYFYSKVNASKIDLVDHPKLNNFLKRMQLNIKEQSDMVEYGGEIYQRTLVYLLRAYPEKVGKLTIDSLRFKITAPSSMYGINGYGGMQSKNIASRPVDINVRDIPSTNVPSDFTGLVGEHDFKLIQKQTKYLANDPIIIKLEVTGHGALEKYEAPAIYQHSSLETFDTKSEFLVLSERLAKKVFDYTYLGRANLSIDKKSITFSYFDPEKGIFAQKTVELPGLVVGGAVTALSQVVSEEKKAVSPSNEKKENIKKEIQEIDLYPPVWNFYSFFTYLWPILTGVLSFAVLILLVIAIYKHKGTISAPKEALFLYRELQKNGLNYSNLYKLLLFLKKNETDSILMNDLINNSSLSKDCKIYFLELVKEAEQINFKQTKGNFVTFKCERKHFNELLKEIKKI